MNEDPRVFSEIFLERAENFTSNYGCSFNLRLGSKVIKLGLNSKTQVGSMIENAFIKVDMDNNSPDFELHIWDSSFPDLLPDFSWATNYIFSNQVIDFELTKPYLILFDRGQGMISVYNTESKKGAVWMRDHSQLDLRCFVSPFRTILSWIANSFDSEILHAASIVVDGQGILFSGASGSGKSTLALYAALNGYGILGDDAVLFEEGNLFSIYSRAKVNNDNSLLDTSKIKKEDFPNFSGKKIINLSEFGENFRYKATMGSFVFPVIVDLSHISLINHEVAARYLIGQSLREVFGGLPKNKIRLIRLLRNYKSYRFALSGDLDRDLKTLQKKLAE